MSPSRISARWGEDWRGLSGARPLSAKESHRIYSALGKKARLQRKERRESYHYRSKFERERAAANGLDESSVDYQEAHDAGVLYRATQDEQYREIWTRVSP
jgi:hypothetical protein